MDEKHDLYPELRAKKNDENIVLQYLHHQIYVLQLVLHYSC